MVTRNHRDKKSSCLVFLRPCSRCFLTPPHLENHHIPWSHAGFHEESFLFKPHQATSTNMLFVSDASSWFILFVVPFFPEIFVVINIPGLPGPIAWIVRLMSSGNRGVVGSRKPPDSMIRRTWGWLEQRGWTWENNLYILYKSRENLRKIYGSLSWMMYIYDDLPMN